jgi:hypothetical protein
VKFIIAGVKGRSAQLRLSIEIDSDPIRGSVAVGSGAPQGFSGWIELVAAIESARHAGHAGHDQTLGLFPGAKVRGM